MVPRAQEKTQAIEASRNEEVQRHQEKVRDAPTPQYHHASKYVHAYVICVVLFIRGSLEESALDVSLRFVPGSCVWYFFFGSH